MNNNIQREDIHTINRYANLQEKEVENALKKYVYADRESWQRFLCLLFISLGVGFTVTGIVFFFAYNWADLHKFIKIGLTEGLVILTTILALRLNTSQTIKNIILSGSAVLVGVLFAVFGQIYQTGANAYDFFLGWTLFISLWVIISNFAPLWVIFLTLINTTLILYSQQVAKDWSGIFVCTLLFSINTIILLGAILISNYKKSAAIPHWFIYIIALAATTFATLGIIWGILDEYQEAFLLLLLLTTGIFSLGIRYGLKTQNRFYLSIISFSLIVIGATFLFEQSSSAMMFLFVCLFIITGITLIIKMLTSIKKKQQSNEE